MSLSDKDIYENIGDIDTTEEVDLHESEATVVFRGVVDSIVDASENPEDALASIGDFLSPFRNVLEADEDGDEDTNALITEAFRLADERNDDNNN